MKRLLFLLFLINGFCYNTFSQLQRIDSTLLETVDSVKITVGDNYALILNPCDSYLVFSNHKYPSLRIAQDSSVLLMSLLKDALNSDNVTKKRDFECEAPDYKLLLYSGGGVSYNRTIWTEREVVYFSNQLVAFLNRVSMMAYNQENSIKSYYGWSMRNASAITREYCDILSSSPNNYQYVLDSIDQTSYRLNSMGYTRKICLVYALFINQNQRNQERQIVVSDIVEKIGVAQDSILYYTRFLDDDLQKELKGL